MQCQASMTSAKISTSENSCYFCKMSAEILRPFLKMKELKKCIFAHIRSV